MRLFLLSFCLLAAGHSRYKVPCLEHFHHRRNTLVRESYRTGVRNLTEVECFLENCNSVTPCAVSYNRETGECVATDPGLLKIAVSLGIPFHVPSGDRQWETLIRSDATETSDGPEALWLLDNVSRGRNLGRAAQGGLDMATDGLTFTGIGPRGQTSARRFSIFTPTNRAFVQLEFEDRALLSLTRDFTFAAWVSLSDDRPMQAIVDSFLGSPTEWRSADNSPHFWTDGTRRLILHLEGFKHAYYTGDAHGDLHEWRHLTVTYSDGDGAHFYVNGRPLGIERRFELDTGLLQPRFIQIGRRGMKNFLLGNLACLAIYERVLCRGEIERLMKSCP